MCVVVEFDGGFDFFFKAEGCIRDAPECLEFRRVLSRSPRRGCSGTRAPRSTVSIRASSSTAGRARSTPTSPARAARAKPMAAYLSWEIVRASCRERASQYVLISVAAVPLQQTQQRQTKADTIKGNVIK